MAFINQEANEINCKVVYYGPAMAGKSTNLEYIFQTSLPHLKSRVTSLAGETDRVIFFDLLKPEFGTWKGLKFRFHFYTVPGNIFYNNSRLNVLKGADGIVFIADSQFERIDSNIESRWNLTNNLKHYQKELSSIPSVIQINKRDLPSAVLVETLKNELWLKREPIFEAVAYKGIGVHDTFQNLAHQVIEKLKQQKESKNIIEQEDVDTLIEISQTHPEANNRAYAIWKLSRISDQRVLDPLIKSLKDPDDDTRWRAIKALSHQADEHALASMIESLTDSSDMVRATVAETIVIKAAKKYVSNLVPLLKDPSAYVRVQVVASLSLLNKEEATDLLLESLHDPNPWVRWSAINSICALKLSLAVELLIQMLLDKKENYSVRSQAAISLGILQDKRAIAPLVKMLDDYELGFCHAIRKALNGLGCQDLVNRHGQKRKTF